VLRDGEVSENFYLIKEHIITVVSKRLGMRIIDLSEQSFFGEYEVLFSSRSEYDYIAHNNNEDS